MSDQKLIEVGNISGFYGVKGWVKIFSDTNPKENILKYRPWMIKLPEKGWTEVKVLNGRLQGKGIVAQLEGYSDKNQVLHLLKAPIAIREDQLPACDAGEYYWRDLIGLAVNNTDGQMIGSVSGVMETGAHDVMKIKTSNAEILVPWVHDVYIKRVDLKAQLITIDWDLENNTDD
jgi:16S rRNA processing protein RimM